VDDHGDGHRTGPDIDHFVQFDSGASEIATDLLGQIDRRAWSKPSSTFV
jgi:hypothetical protein